MARPKEYDSDDVLDRAVALLRRKGFADTSVDDVVRESGINRHSLYASFGSKHGLYLAALDRWRDVTVGGWLERLTADDAGLADIEAFFARIVAGASQPDGQMGCLLCTAGVEVAPDDAEVAARVHAYTAHLETAFRNALMNARVAGDLPDKRDVADQAAFLTAMVQSASLLARTPGNADLIARYVRTGLAALR